MPRQTKLATHSGQMITPATMHRKLDIQQGSPIRLRVGDQHAEALSSGFGLLKTTKPSVPVDFNVAALVHC